MLAGGRNSRCNPLDESPFSFLLCVSFLLVTPPPRMGAHQKKARSELFRTQKKARARGAGPGIFGTSFTFLARHFTVFFPEI